VPQSSTNKMSMSFTRDGNPSTASNPSERPGQDVLALVNSRGRMEDKGKKEEKNKEECPGKIRKRYIYIRIFLKKKQTNKGQPVRPASSIRPESQAMGFPVLVEHKGRILQA
jgi:hypothetical protein